MNTKVKIIKSGVRQKNGTGGPEKEQQQTRRNSWRNSRCRKQQGRRAHKGRSSCPGAIQCFRVILCDGTARAASQTSLDLCPKRVGRTESSKEAEPVPSSGTGETAACLPSPSADNTSPLPSSTSSPVGSSSCLFTGCQFLMPAVALYYCTFKVLYSKIKNVLFFVF